MESVKIARCPEHGLHGERSECFVCGGPVDQVEMVPAVHAEELTQRIGDLEARFSGLVAILGPVVPRVDALERLAGGANVQLAEGLLQTLGPVRYPGSLELTREEQDRIREAVDA